MTEIADSRANSTSVDTRQNALRFIIDLLVVGWLPDPRAARPGASCRDAAEGPISQHRTRRHRPAGMRWSQAYSRQGVPGGDEMRSTRLPVDSPRGTFNAQRWGQT